jgi:ABC-type sugar transport system permease subunit
MARGGTRVNREAVGMSPATPWLFVAPAALLIAATILTPIVMSAWISLHSWSMLTPLSAMQWVGLDNYATILGDASFLRALTNTAVFAGAFVIIAVPLSLLMAVLVTRSRVRGARVVLVLLFTT